MAINNFKNLFDDDNDAFDFEPHIKKVEHNLKQNQRSTSFFSSVIDLFVPNIVRTIVNMAGGDNENEKPNPSQPDTRTHRWDDRSAPTGKNERNSKK